MQSYVTAAGGTFNIHPLTFKRVSAAGAQLRKDGVPIKDLDPETNPQMAAELARQCLAAWTLEGGEEPLKGLTPKAARELLMEDPFVMAFVLSKAKEQADEWAKRFEVVSGN